MTADNEDINHLKTDIAVILERTKVLPAINDKVNEIDKKQSELCADVRHNKEDIKALESKSNTWNLINSLGAGLAAVVGSVFGAGK